MIGLSFRWPAPMICCACPMYWDTERFARSLQLASLPTMSPLHQHRSTVSFVVRTHAPAQPQDFPIDAHDDPSSAYLIAASAALHELRWLATGFELTNALSWHTIAL